MAVYIPNSILNLLSAMNAAGFEAHLVGGCVRDWLLNRQPQDWDICTSALPEETLALFPGSLPTGLKHGTVTVYTADASAEVTTYRSEGIYADHRRPDSVTFIRELSGDLQRRDFTINAMAMDTTGAITDLYGGMADLQAHTIRCVGTPDTRFSEDALRMFRAIRFSAQLDFSIEPATMAAIYGNAPLAREIAAERIETELTKTLLSPHPEKAVLFFQTGLMDRFLLKPAPRDLSCPLRPGLSRSAIYTSLCLSLLSAAYIADTGRFLRALHLDHKTIALVQSSLQILAEPLPENETALKRLLAVYGDAVLDCAAQLAPALLPLLESVRRSGDCCSLQNLAVNGRDLLALGLSGKAVGNTLQSLLEHVIEQPELNTKAQLLALLPTLRN